MDRNKISPYALGATLYMPATREDITRAVLHNTIPDLRSLVICLEDAVTEHQLPSALENLTKILNELAERQGDNRSPQRPLVFIRPRNIAVANTLVATQNLSAVTGFVLPKFNIRNMDEWFSCIAGTDLLVMPTLETADVFEPAAMAALADTLSTHALRERILALRIGGNDLMSILKLRRPRDGTLYDGPMGWVIKSMVATFSPKGFHLTAPVFEHVSKENGLLQELKLDVAHGLVGKTAIHPLQLPLIHASFKVDPQDYAEAYQILNSDQAVFKMNGSMCEPATHLSWAKDIMERVEHFGHRRHE